LAERVMAVYDEDSFYAERLADFINHKKQAPFKALAFTALEKLKGYGKDHEINLLLIQAEVSREEIAGLRAEQVFYLCDGEEGFLEEPSKGIYKYQAADGILRDVMKAYLTSDEEAGSSMISRTGKVIGIYSPINRCLKTSFSLTMGQLLSRDLKVLYLNFEDCSGLGRLIGEELKGGLSDLFYYYSQEKYSWIRLGSLVYTWGELDYVPPVQYPEDLNQIGALEVADLVRRIARESPYETIILDLGQFGRKAAEVLDVCDIIYMPVMEDCVSAAKIEEFEEYLITSGQESIKKRVQKIKLPYHCNFGRRDSYLEQLLWSELGDYTRQLLRKQP
jgi:hypothetical protein